MKEVESDEGMLKVEKKPLRQFLPYDKYTKYKNKLLKKHTNEAIDHVQIDKNQILSAVENLKIF